MLYEVTRAFRSFFVALAYRFLKLNFPGEPPARTTQFPGYGHSDIAE
jgi:hypothetical protein